LTRRFKATNIIIIIIMIHYYCTTEQRIYSVLVQRCQQKQIKRVTGFWCKPYHVRQICARLKKKNTYIRNTIHYKL